MTLRYPTRQILAALLPLFLLTGCEDTPSQQADGETAALDTTLSAEAQTVEKLIYALPAPQQALALLKVAGARYDARLLNSEAQVVNYQSGLKAAMNIGVYSTDLAYASTFNQSQVAVKYFLAVQKLGDQLGIASAFDEGVVARVDKYKENQDSVIKILSRAFEVANRKLQKNGQDEIARNILVGGWVEGLYLATAIYKVNSLEPIGRRIAEQKLALDNLIQLLERNKISDDFRPYYQQMKDIQTAFAPISIEYSFSGTQTDEKKRITRINNSNEVRFTQEQLLAIHEKVAALRKAIVA